MPATATPSAIDTALDALYSILNIEGAALYGVRLVPAYDGLDVPYHFEKVRTAIRAIEASRR